MHKKLIMGAIYFGVIVIYVMAALWIGKTKVDENWHLTIERPVAAILFFLAMLACLLNI